jgi:putative toxin-antitoxin system antitoxin component (TIGR02293 family)
MNAGVLSTMESDGFAALLAGRPADRDGIIAAIRAGFPLQMVNQASAYFGVPAARMRAVLRMPDLSAQARSKRGANMDSAASERLWRIADTFSMAREIFDGEDEAKKWMCSPSGVFHNAAPIDYLDTEPGAAAVRQVLNALATGGPV